jgi:hypothetical protein
VEAQYIIPFFLLLITSGEEFSSSIGMYMDMCSCCIVFHSSLVCGEHPTGANMHEGKHKKLKSKSTTLSSRICDESGSTRYIDDVPLIEREILIVLEILIYWFRKALLISEYLGVKMHI